MIMNKHPKRLFFVGFLSALTSGCSGDNDDLQQYINEIKRRPPKTIEAIPKFAPLPIFKFPENDVRRSPFKPVDLKKRNEQFAPDKNRKREPLESFPLDAIKFVGILKQGNETWALIREPDSQIVRARVGGYMGQNYGRIMSINEDTIKLEETIKNSGTWEKVTTTLKLDTGKVGA